MNRISTFVLSPIIVVLILITVGASVYSGYRYLQLKHETDIMRLLPKENATWGAMQLNIEGLKFADALHSVVIDNSPETRKKLSLRLEILYSRVDVIAEVFGRIEQWESMSKGSDPYQQSIDFKQKVGDAIREIQENFTVMDREVQNFLTTAETGRLFDIRSQLDHIITLSSELASQVNQATNQIEYNARENVLDQTHQFQIALLTIIISFIFFSATILALYVNARRAEIESKRTAKKLLAASQAKTSFLSSMSHELRTPMNAILGFTQFLQYNPKEPLTETQNSSVDHILRGGNHLLELIEQVLELSKIEAGHLSLNVDHTLARDVIDQSLSLIQARADRNGIKIIDQIGRDDLPLLWTDRTRLVQVLVNLLSNAVKYNCANGTVTLTCQERPDRMLRISVADSGMGIPTEKQDDLFKPFERLGLESGAIEGTGIGLTITKQIIEVLGGHIGFESEVGKGSTFWVDIPMSEKQDTGVAIVKMAISPGKMIEELDKTGSQYTILYVEDIPDNLKLMEMIIGRIGNTSLLTAHNAELGLDLAKSEHPDLILMDINLPGMNGIEALKQLQDTAETKDIPVIAIIAAAMPNEIEAGIQAGFREYITKPINVPEFIRTIEEMLDSIEKSA